MCEKEKGSVDFIFVDKTKDIIEQCCFKVDFFCNFNSVNDSI
jgi:hypothetical protein